MAQILRVISGGFNIGDSGWEHFGNNRNYIAQSIDRTINGDIVQERVERRVMYGYLGHSQPYDEIKGKDGDDKNPPSHATSFLKFYPKSGDVEYKHEIRNTPKGKQVLVLNDGGIGGFSWKGDGRGNFLGVEFKPQAQRHLRFDYVRVPGFIKQTMNDIPINESAEGYDNFAELFAKYDLDISESIKDLVNWQNQGLFVSGIEKAIQDRIFENEILSTQLDASKAHQLERETVIDKMVERYPFHISNEGIEILKGGAVEPEQVVNFLNELTEYRNVDLSQFPSLSGHLPGAKFPDNFNNNVEKQNLVTEPASFIAGYEF